MKKALIIIGAIVAIFLLVTALLPSTSHVERSTSIYAPASLIFDQVNDLEKNFNWSPWLSKDPNMTVEWGDKRAGEGASYSWSGNKDVGSGTMTIAVSKPNEYIENDLDFGEMGVATGTWKFETAFVEQDDGSLMEATTVTWAFDNNDLGWPMGRIFGLMMDGFVGADFEAGLAKLKEVCETLPVEDPVMVEEADVDAMTLLVLKDSSGIDEIGPAMGAAYGELMGYVESTGLQVISYPVCVYFEWNTEGNFAKYACALPVAEGTEVESDRLEVMSLPARKAAKAVNMGSYDNLNKVHYALEDWVQKNSRTMTGAPYEVYVTDPGAEPDTAKWITEVYYPVQ